MIEIEAVQHEGVWYVAHRSDGAPMALYTTQQARDQARTADDLGNADLATRLRDVGWDVQRRNGMTDLAICKRLLDEVATIETTDLRANASRVAQQCRAALGEGDLASLRQELADELARRRPMIVGSRDLRFHDRRLAVLEAALGVLSDDRRDA
jgi:hypothetical protein